MNLCIVQPNLNVISETFIRAHIERLPAKISVIHGVGNGFPKIGQRPVLSQRFPSRALRKLGRIVKRRPWNWEYNAAYIKTFKNLRPDAVLAEYGQSGVAVRKACEFLGIPLIVHFHGYDAHKHDVLEKHAEDYRRMFASAAAIIAVSTTMREQLISLGAPPEKTHLNIYGVDLDRFQQGTPEKNDCVFLATGRFVDKKAPHLTILAFHQLLADVPNAKLKMIGDGPLWSACCDMVQALGIADQVELLGSQPHERVSQELRNARAFIQHSLVARNGDSEGTPNAILEAGACGIPVISTRHAGIQDVVVEGETGLLVNERDIDGMANQMRTLALNSEQAGEMGRAARERIAQLFSIETSIARLWSVIEAAASLRQIEPLSLQAGEFASFANA